MATPFLGLVSEDWQASPSVPRSVGRRRPGQFAVGVVLVGCWLAISSARPLGNAAESAPGAAAGRHGLSAVGVVRPARWLGGFLHNALGIEVAFTWMAAALAGAVMGFPPGAFRARGLSGRRSAFRRRLVRWGRTVRRLPNGESAAGASRRHRRRRVAFARGLGEFGATLLFAGSQPGRRTLAVQL